MAGAICAVIRSDIGRLTSVPVSYKKPLTKDITHIFEWHARMTEMMFRGLCDDRGLGKVLGEMVL